MKLPVPGPIPEQGSASVQATLGLGGKVEYSVQTAEDASGLIGIVEKQTLVNAATVATSGAMPSNPQLAAQVNAEGQRLLGLTPEDNAFANKNITAIQMGGGVAARANVNAPGMFTNSMPPGIAIAKGQVDDFVRIELKASLTHYNNTGSFGVLGAAFETSSGAAIKGEIEAHHGVRDMDDAPLWEYNGNIPQAASGIGGWLQAQLDKVPPEAWDALRYLP